MLVYWRVLSGGPILQALALSSFQPPRSLGFENRLEFNEGLSSQKKSLPRDRESFGGFAWRILGHELSTFCPQGEPGGYLDLPHQLTLAHNLGGFLRSQK